MENMPAEYTDMLVQGACTLTVHPLTEWALPTHNRMIVSAKKILH